MSFFDDVSNEGPCAANILLHGKTHGSLRDVPLQYMNNDGERTLRSYSRPVNLAAVFGPKWATVRGDVFHVAEFMVRIATRRYARCQLNARGPGFFPAKS